jgi:hypothetical protein
MKKTLSTIALAAFLMVGTAFAGDDGIIVAGITDNANTAKDGIIVAGVADDGIIVAGFTGIIVAGFTGIIVAG